MLNLDNIQRILIFVSENVDVKNKSILFFNHSQVNFISTLLVGEDSNYHFSEIYLIESSKGSNLFMQNTQSDKLTIFFEVEMLSFLNLLIETNTTFDLIIFLVDFKYIDSFRMHHEEYINIILEKILKNSGFLFLILETRIKNIREYPIKKLYRRMSDNLTKKIFGNDSDINIQVHSFYK